MSKSKIKSSSNLDAPSLVGPALGGQQPLCMVYENYRGETSERRIIPNRIWFGATSYHTTPQWLMDAFDLDKGEHRAFALCDVKSFSKA